MIKAFIFDLDGVITETFMFHFKAWKIIVKKYFNINYTEKENDALKGLSRKDTLLAILKNHNLINKIDNKIINNVCKEKNDLYISFLNSELSKKNILPGVKIFLEKAKNLNIKLGIASSSYNAPKILKKLELDIYFDYVCNPLNIKNGKPAPDIYLDVVDYFNLKPNECVGFEDAIAGIKGLFNAKIPSVAFTYGVKENWKLANIIYNNTLEINLNEILKLGK